MRFHLRSGEQSTKYRPGQFVSASYAARYPHKVRAEERPAVEEEFIPEEFVESDEWEITSYYEEVGG